MKKIILLFVILSALVLISFALFGERFDEGFGGENGRDFFRQSEAVAGPAGAGLLIADLVLPIPTTMVIGGMGAVLGILPAAIWGWVGLSLAGLLGYGVARAGGSRWADRLASPEEQRQYRELFDTWGGLAVVLSRMLPILPEVLSVLAGLYGMQFKNFALAVTLGSIPPALIFAWMGAQSRENPGPALWALLILTTLLWLLYVRVSRKSSGRANLQRESSETLEKD
ncbi:MAG: TVP38/TMEM64 family protein [Kiritimatiellia bacterium]